MPAPAAAVQVKPRVARITDMTQEPLQILPSISGYADLPVVPLEKAIQPLLASFPAVICHANAAKDQCPKPPPDGLSVDESAAIMLYTMCWKPQNKCLHVALNAALRSEDRTKIELWLPYLKLFLTALERLPSLNQTVYRGIKQDMQKDYRNGEALIWWGVSSCTASVDALQSEVFVDTTGVRTVFAIECTSAKDIHNHSSQPSDNEILLLPATQFKIVACLDQGQDLHKIQLQETTPSSPLRQLAIASTTNKSSEGKTKIATQSKTDQDLKTLVDPNNILVWLDSEKALLSDGYPNTMIQLRQIFETIHTLNDREQCIKIIKENGDKNIFLIISGAFGQELVPNIHQMSQLNAIFVFCGNKPRHELWARQYIKVNGVFTEIALLCEAVKQIVKQQATSIRIIARNDETTKQNPDQIDRSLLYIQILKEIILQIRFDDRDIADFITYCRQKFAGNDRELKDCDKLEQEYHSHTPVWWYTYECFLYPMLNKALQILDVDVIIKMGFFMQNLHRQIEKLHSEQFRNNQKSEVFVVYRGQGLPTTDFQQLMQSKGGLLSFNNFSLTSKNRDTSLSFARDALNNPGSHGILFSMRIDPSIPFVPYASIDNIACSNTDDEILFSIHTIFRIIDIKQIDNNARLWQIDLTLINDNDSQIHLLTKHMQDETKGPTGWHRLGKFLSKIGLFDKAEELFNVLLSQTNEDREVAILYNQLGLIKNKKQDYSAAVKFYEQAIEIWKKSASPNNPDLAECYSNIGSVYVKMGERSKVISCYEQAVDIGKRSQSPNLQQWQKTLDNIKNNSK